MKRSFVVPLAVGPLFVFGQRLDQPPTFKSFQYGVPGPARSGDTVFSQRWLTRPGMPVRVSSAFPVRGTFTAGFAVRELSPDRMACLVPLRMPEQMPMSLRGNADPLPNAINKR